MEGSNNIVERDVDIDGLAKQIDALATDNDKVTVLTGGKTKNVGRHEFIRAAQLYKPKVAIVDLPAPFEGRQMKVRELTAGERDTYESKMLKGKLGQQKIDMTELRVGLIIASAVDWEDESTPLFTEKDKGDLKHFGISVIQAIYEVASKLSAVSKEDEDELMGE